jgi:hypothetical protein
MGITQITLNVNTEELAEAEALYDPQNGLGLHLINVMLGREDKGFSDSMGLALWGVDVVDTQENLEG